MRIIARAAVLATLTLLLAAPASAAVGVSVDVLWNPNPDNDSQVWLHASNMAYPMPRQQVEPVFNSMSDPYSDYPMLAFIAYHGHVNIKKVWKYHRKGHGWVDVMFHFGVPPSALFAELPYKPGPPYGKAYGKWKKYRNRMSPNFITEKDIRFWVGLHTAAAYGGVTVVQAYDWHKSGKNFKKMAGKSYREKHAKAHKEKPQQHKGGHNQGHGKAKGHDKD